MSDKQQIIEAACAKPGVDGDIVRDLLCTVEPLEKPINVLSEYSNHRRWAGRHEDYLYIHPRWSRANQATKQAARIALDLIMNANGAITPRGLL